MARGPGQGLNSVDPTSLCAFWPWSGQERTGPGCLASFTMGLPFEFTVYGSAYSYRIGAQGIYCELCTTLRLRGARAPRNTHTALSIWRHVVTVTSHSLRYLGTHPCVSPLASLHGTTRARDVHVSTRLGLACRISEPVSSHVTRHCLTPRLTRRASVYTLLSQRRGS